MTHPDDAPDDAPDDETEPQRAPEHAGGTIDDAGETAQPGGGENATEGRKRGRNRPNKGTVNPRATKAQLAQRVALVVGLLTAGERRAGVLRAVAEAQRIEADTRRLARAGAIDPRTRAKAIEPAYVWGDESIPERTIDYYITKATAIFDEAAKYVAERELGKAIMRHDDLYGRAIRDKQWNVASLIERRRNELLGLGTHGKPLGVELTGLNGGPVQTQHVPPAKMTEEQRAAEVAALLEVARRRLGASAASSTGVDGNGTNPHHN